VVARVPRVAVATVAAGIVSVDVTLVWEATGGTSGGGGGGDGGSGGGACAEEVYGVPLLAPSWTPVHVAFPAPTAMLVAYARAWEDPPVDPAPDDWRFCLVVCQWPAPAGGAGDPSAFNIE